MFLTTLTLLAPFLLIGLLGALCACTPRFADSLKPINDFVLYVALPCYLYFVVSHAPLSTTEQPWIQALLGPILVGIAFMVVGRFLRGRSAPGSSTRRRASALTLAGTWGNVGFMGIPISIALAGPNAGLAAGVIQLLHNLLFLVGYPLMRRIVVGREVSGASLPWWRRIWKILRSVFSPVTLGFLAGFLVNMFSVPVPKVVGTTIDLIAGATVPLAIFAIGLSAPSALRAMRKGTMPLITVVGMAILKTLILPLIGIGILVLTHVPVDSPWTLTAVAILAVPSASAVLNYALEYERDPDAAASVILATILICPVTIPAMMTLATMVL